MLAVRLLAGVDRLHRWLLEQPFVGRVTPVADAVSFEFEADEAAQHDLLKRMLVEGFAVLEFRGKTESLEDAFMAITKGITQ